MSLVSQHQDIIVAAFEHLQIPLATEKLEGPTTKILDTVRIKAGLPEDKLSELGARHLKLALFATHTPSQSSPPSWASSPLLQQWLLWLLPARNSCAAFGMLRKLAPQARAQPDAVDFSGY